MPEFDGLPAAVAGAEDDIMTAGRGVVSVMAGLTITSGDDPMDEADDKTITVTEKPASDAATPPAPPPPGVHHLIAAEFNLKPEPNKPQTERLPALLARLFPGGTDGERMRKIVKDVETATKDDPEGPISRRTISRYLGRSK
jgi:hypothetical protein